MMEVSRHRVPAVVVGSTALLSLSGLTRLGQVAASFRRRAVGGETRQLQDGELLTGRGSRP